MSILIVDDELVSGSKLDKIMAKFGFRDLAENGEHRDGREGQSAATRPGLFESLPRITFF